MSKSNSGLFSGTVGDKLSRRTSQPMAESIDTTPTESDIIASRVKKLDLREHPLKHRELSSAKMAELRKKANARTITKKEYRIYDSNKRLAKRRQAGVENFWKQETKRIIRGEATTRNWTPEQRHDIVNNIRPKANGKTIQSHHSYSVSKYPHLANRGEVIFPATFREHLYEWHGGNFKKSLPGRPIKPRKHSN